VVINGSSIILEYYKENKELKGLQVGTKYINEQLEGAQDTIKALRNKVYRLEEQKTLSKSRGIKPKAGISTEKQQAKEAARILAKQSGKQITIKKSKC
jgi:predicted  nucleic acid-binding Zn-ribbon protein